MTRRKAVDSNFKAIRDKVGKDESVMVLCSNGSFPPSSNDEDSVPTGNMRRHFLTRSAGEHSTSRGCPFFQKNHLVPMTADGRVQESDTSLDGRNCTACNLGGEAGRGEGTARRVMQKDKHAAMNIRRGGVAEMKGKKRPCGLQNAESLV
jgi:hypothetical protein